MKIGVLVGSLALLLLAACAQASRTSPGSPGTSDEPTGVGFVAVNGLTPEEVTGAVMDTLPGIRERQRLRQTQRPGSPLCP